MRWAFIISYFLICFVFVLMPNGSKHWCFTLNNYTSEDVEHFNAVGEKGDGIRYFIYGKEVGDQGTPHLQCFVSFDRRRSLSFCRRFFCDRAHFESAKGSPSQNKVYCSKGCDFREFGVVPVGRGDRTDLATFVASVKSGMRKEALLESYLGIYARYPRFAGMCSLMYSKKREWKTLVTVYWGETGTGKTRKAFEEAGAGVYVHPGGKWFDGYEEEENVIFDDFGGSEFKLTYLLKLLDRYQMRVPVKGGFVNWCPKKIWITSNYSPKEWYLTAKDEHVKAMFRRFERVVRFRRLASCIAPGDDSFEEELCLP